MNVKYKIKPTNIRVYSLETNVPDVLDEMINLIAYVYPDSKCLITDDGWTCDTLESLGYNIESLDIRASGMWGDLDELVEKELEACQYYSKAFMLKHTNKLTIKKEKSGKND